jgi:hypothetical protein
MYSGTTLTAASGRLAGAHQKIDRIARRQLTLLLTDKLSGPTTSEKTAISTVFPGIRSILHFEGRNGPDGIKRKSPAQDEPWHYVSPFDSQDTILIELIEEHYKNLVAALRKHDMVVAGFEAAWLAHAVVDGLTPAHHYPYEAKLDELRGGLGKETRITFRDKLIMPGSTRHEAFVNNWKMWGPKGLLTTHFAFEWGVSSILLPMRATQRRPSAKELKEVRSMSVREYFLLSAKEIAALGIYDEFRSKGWTPRLARTVRRQLVPTLIKSVSLLWYRAYAEAAQEA